MPTTQKLQIPIKRFENESEHTHSINKIDLVARRLTFSTIYCNGTISWLIHYGQSLSLNIATGSRLSKRNRKCCSGSGGSWWPSFDVSTTGYTPQWLVFSGYYPVDCTEQRLSRHLTGTSWRQSHSHLLWKARDSCSFPKHLHLPSSCPLCFSLFDYHLILHYIR